MRTKELGPDEWSDDCNEIISVAKKYIGKLPCCASKSCSDWFPRGGKYQRITTQNADIYKASLTLSAILGNRLYHQVRGNFYYPPGGYREWHTNQYDAHGWRLYLVHTRRRGECPDGEERDFPVYNANGDHDSDGYPSMLLERDATDTRRNAQGACAFFRYVHPQSREVLTLPDFDGCLRLFYVGTGPAALLWHAVYSEEERWSLGYILSDQAAEALIRHHAKSSPADESSVVHSMGEV